MEDNKTSEEQPMTTEEFLKIIDSNDSGWTEDDNEIIRYLNKFKDSHTAPLQAEIESLKKEVERLSQYVVFKPFNTRKPNQ